MVVGSVSHDFRLRIGPTGLCPSGEVFPLLIFVVKIPNADDVMVVQRMSLRHSGEVTAKQFGASNFCASYFVLQRHCDRAWQMTVARIPAWSHDPYSPTGVTSKTKPDGGRKNERGAQETGNRSRS